MINLPKLENSNITGKRVIVRMDLDIPQGDINRLRTGLPTLKYLLDHGNKIVIIGHKGRPSEEGQEALSLESLVPHLENLLGLKVNFIQEGQITLMENLRFDPGEEANSVEFAQSLASLGDFYVNEAFASSHRVHSSIVALPKLLPHATGLRFSQEVENLSKVIENPQRPLVFIVSGVKEDKLSYINKFKEIADKILIAGRLPIYLEDNVDSKILVARLVADQQDITLHSVEAFEKEIALARTIVVSGPMGKFEEEGHDQGTKRILSAVINSTAFKIAGGGDTQNAIRALSKVEGFDWISTGGGAMLEFLANKTLPGLEALLE